MQWIVGFNRLLDRLFCIQILQDPFRQRLLDFGVSWYGFYLRALGNIPKFSTFVPNLGVSSNLNLLLNSVFRQSTKDVRFAVLQNQFNSLP